MVVRQVSILEEEVVVRGQVVMAVMLQTRLAVAQEPVLMAGELAEPL